MARALGIYSLPPIYLATTGQTVIAAQHNAPLEDIAQALTGSLPRDGSAPMQGNLPLGGYKITGAAQATNSDEFVTLAQVQDMLAAIATVPTGMMTPYTISSATAPAGWLFANGQEVSRATFASLWAAVSAGNNLAASQGAKAAGQYGPGNGATTFTLPNLYADSGYFIRPVSSGRGIGSVQADEIKSHGHTGSALSAGAHAHSYTAPVYSNEWHGQNITERVGGTTTASTSSAGEHTHVLSIDATGGTETRPKNIAYPVLIKT